MQYSRRRRRPGRRRATLASIMKPALLYRIASILLILFAVGHTLGFRQVDPKWGVDSLIQSMRSVHFNANGSERTYWDFYVGFGLFVTALMALASLFAWQLGGLPAATLASMRITAWGFVLCFAFVAFLSWRYFFLVPLIFSVTILVCLTLAASLSGNPGYQK
jgi:sterol desaturase/sphingolipid hydroxylase (fatty acid hydroxylase superfamily)